MRKLEDKIMDMNLYIVVEAYDSREYVPDEEGTMIIGSYCSADTMDRAICEKNLRANYSDDEKYNHMTDFEILEEVLCEWGHMCEDMTPVEQFMFDW